MDGRFVPIITLGPLFVAAVRKAVDITVDVHLMIEEPDRQLQAFRDAGGDIINVHVEACRHLHRVLGEIRRLGARAGVCINPGTSLSAIEEVLTESDQVMVMGVNPGWGGQPFIASTPAKVERLVAQRRQRGLAFEVEVDGGINLTTAPNCAKAGADVLVCGSSVYNDRASVMDNLAALRAALSKT